MGQLLYSRGSTTSWFGGNKEGVLHYKKLLTEKIDCDDSSPLTDYVGNKIDIDRKNRSMRVTQPVLLRSLKDEFNVEVPENCPTTPAAPGSVLRGTSEENTVGYPEQRRYRSGVGKLLYLMKWSRPDVLNSVISVGFYQVHAQHISKRCTELWSIAYVLLERGYI